MTDRPAIVSAKLDKLTAITADADDLKAMPKSNRPNEATLDDVRAVYRDASNELTDGHGSVSSINSVELPSDRL